MSRCSIRIDIGQVACWPSLIPSEDRRKTGLSSGRCRWPSAVFFYFFIFLIVFFVLVWGSQEVVVAVVVVCRELESEVQQ